LLGNVAYSISMKINQKNDIQKKNQKKENKDFGKSKDYSAKITQL